MGIRVAGVPPAPASIPRAIGKLAEFLPHLLRVGLHDLLQGHVPLLLGERHVLGDVGIVEQIGVVGP